jgi:hypothetical protein
MTAFPTGRPEGLRYDRHLAYYCRSAGLPAFARVSTRRATARLAEARSARRRQAWLALTFLLFGSIAVAQPVTYSKDVAPLLADRCGMCHHPGGSAPFTLLTYADARRHAGQIATVTANRFMPPWKADPADGPFVGQHPLDNQEILLLRRWLDAGAPEGDPRDLPPAHAWVEGWQLGKPDLVITLEQPYTLQAEGTDAFRIFVLPIPVEAARFVRGLEFRPGNPKVVHHANIRIDTTPASRRLDEADPGPGYDGLIARSATYPDGHFLGWTPGQVAPLLPPDLAWRREKNTDLVVELHMQPSGKAEQVSPSIGLYFGDAAPTQTPAMLRLGAAGHRYPRRRREIRHLRFLHPARRRRRGSGAAACALSRS